MRTPVGNETLLFIAGFHKTQYDFSALCVFGSMPQQETQQLRWWAKISNHYCWMITSKYIFNRNEKNHANRDKNTQNNIKELWSVAVCLMWCHQYHVWKESYSEDIDFVRNN